MAQSAQSKRQQAAMLSGGLVAYHRFSVADYHRMGEAGIFKPRDRVELIEGEIIEMSPIGSAHASRLKRLNALFSLRLGKRAIIQVHDPVVLNRFSEPQPDLAVLKPRADFYATRHPHPDDILLVVEVSDTTRDFDRKVKVPLYARTGVREVWVVDLVDETIHVYRHPVGAWYRDVTEAQRGQRVAMAAFSNVMFRVSDILG